MPADIVEVTIKGLMPTANGCAVFLGNDEKTFVIYVDPGVGSAISMTINGVKKERPLTHDLIGHLLLGFEINLERIIINDVNEGTYFAR
ncbi:MAG TPA: bifunctional nuclease domain-containing protein, partial [Lacunisphaera sp.]|nr:bifunctional nuclease domain-containing protein [Lacunisphaera sp.]